MSLSPSLCLSTCLCEVVRAVCVFRCACGCAALVILTACRPLATFRAHCVTKQIHEWALLLLRLLQNCGCLEPGLHSLLAVQETGKAASLAGLFKCELVPDCFLVGAVVGPVGTVLLESHHNVLCHK